jgi:hypothetical protein
VKTQFFDTRMHVYTWYLSQHSHRKGHMQTKLTDLVLCAKKTRDDHTEDERNSKGYQRWVNNAGWYSGRTNVKSALLYGIEIWKVTNTISLKLQVFHNTHSGRIGIGTTWAGKRSVTMHKKDADKENRLNNGRGR